MPWAWAAGGAIAGSSVLGAAANNSGQGGLFDTSKTRRRALRGILDRRYREMQSDYIPFFAQAEALQKQSIDTIKTGFTKARSEVSRAGTASRQAAVDTERRTLGAASQNLVSRGLSGSSVGANMARGIASDTNRRILEIEEALAGVYASLQTSEAGAVAAAQQGLSGLKLQEFQAQQAGKEALNQWRIFRATGQNTQQPSPLTPLAAGLGSLGGLFGAQWLFGGGAPTKPSGTYPMGL